MIVKIAWDEPDDSNWLNAWNVQQALSVYCRNTAFEVTGFNGHQPCGHPAACIVNSEEGTSYCGWCAEVARLREALADLFDQVGTTPDAYGEMWCQWCQSKGETGLVGDIAHKPGCPFASLSDTAIKQADDDV